VHLHTRRSISILCKWPPGVHLHTRWSVSILCKWPPVVQVNTRWSLTENTIPDSVSVFSVSDHPVCTCTPDGLLVFSASGRQVCKCTPDSHLWEYYTRCYSSILCKWTSVVQLHTRQSLTENTIPDAVSVFSASGRQVCKCTPDSHLQRILCHSSILCKWMSIVQLHTRRSLTENTIPDAVSVFSVSDYLMCTCTPDGLLVFSASDCQVCTCTPDSHLQRILCYISILCKWTSVVQLQTRRSLTENTTSDAALIQFDLLMMNRELLETCTDRIIIINLIYNCASSWSFTQSYQDVR